MTNLPKLLCERKVCISISEARRFIWQGGLRLNGEQIIFKEGEKPELELKPTDRLEVRIKGKSTPIVP